MDDLYQKEMLLILRNLERSQRKIAFEMERKNDLKQYEIDRQVAEENVRYYRQKEYYERYRNL